MASRVGLISDTHGLLRPEALAFLEGCDRIVHGGDVCDPEVLEVLAGIAPVTAVRGNNDLGVWSKRLPVKARLTVEDVAIFVVHDLHDLHGDPKARVVVSGHSHRPRTEDRNGVLYVNPGSAGPRRFSLPIAVGELRIDGEDVVARVVELQVARR